MKSLLKTSILSTFIIILTSCQSTTTVNNPNPSATNNPNPTTSNTPNPTTSINPNPAPSPAVSEVLIQSFAFSPSTITVPVNTTVIWTNKDSAAHTVTSDTPAFDSGTMNNNGTFSFKFTTAGTFPYHCAFHSGMKGQVIAK